MLGANFKSFCFCLCQMSQPYLAPSGVTKNRVLVLTGLGKGGDFTSAGWQVRL